MNMKSAVAVVAFALIGSTNAAQDPEVYFDVTVRNDGAVVETAASHARLGTTTRIPLKNGMSVDAIAQPRETDGRSRILVRINLAERGDSRMTHEFADRIDLAKSSPSFEYRMPMTKLHLVTVVRSPALLAEVR